MAANVSGFWTGTYWYDEPGEQAVRFLALLNDANGALSGEISEPNTIGISSGHLKAFIVGMRYGSRVAFAKVYDGASDVAHRVDYTGSLSDDATRISGYWLLEEYSGEFEMSRTIVPAEEADTRQAEDKVPAGFAVTTIGENI